MARSSNARPSNYSLSLLSGLILSGLDVTEEVKAQQATTSSTGSAPAPTNRYRIRILDVSGSMHYDISRMFQHLYADIRAMEAGDRLTVIKFSGPGQAQVIAMDQPIDQDRETLIASLTKHQYSMGTTEFSGALRLAFGVAHTFKNLPVSLVFFTDGFPVVSDTQEELRVTYQVLRDLSSLVREALFVAYGNYPNIPVMQQMAAEVGGTLTRAADMGQVAAQVAEFDESSATNEARIRVLVPTTEGKVTYFSLSGDSIMMYSPDKDGTIDFIPNIKTKRQRVYVLSESALPEKEEGEMGLIIQDLAQLSEAQIRGDSSRMEFMTKGVYASVVLLNQQLRTDQAAEVASKFLGDKLVVSKLLNAWTSREHADLEALLRVMMARPKQRLAQGYQLGCLPDENAFSVVDALLLAAKDKEARFYPHSKNPDGSRRMAYHHISRRTKLVDEDRRDSWLWDSTCGVPFNLKLTDERGNIGVGGYLTGTLKLRGDYAAMGFAEIYPSHQFRTYNLVVDGACNVDSIPMSMSEETFNQYLIEGLLPMSESFSPGAIYDVNLRAVPTVNRARAKEAVDAKKLCSAVFSEKKLAAKIRVFKYLLLQIESKALLEDEAWGVGLSEAQVTYLQSQGITGRHGFRPETEQCEITDHYMTKTLHVLPASLSNWSKVADVITKLKEGKKLTLNEQLQAEAYAQYQTSFEILDMKIRRLMLQAAIEDAESLREELQETIRLSTLTIIGTGLWFEGAKSRDEAEFEYDFPLYPKMKFTIVAKQMRVDI